MRLTDFAKWILVLVAWGAGAPHGVRAAEDPASQRALPCTLTVTNVTPKALPAHLDPFTNPSPDGQWRDFPVSTIVIGGELWIIYKNGYSDKVVRYKGPHMEDMARQPDGKLNPRHPTHGTVVHPYLLGGMWYDAVGKKLYAPMHCEYPPATSGDGIVLRQVHLATSTDTGLTWSYEGPLLTGDRSAAPFDNSGPFWDGGDGDFYLYVDEPGGSFYLFTTYYLWPKPGVQSPYFMRHRAARCKISDKMAPGKWQRFYQGGWEEPGIGGKSSYVDAHRVIYSTYLKRYVSFNYGSGLSVCSDLGKQDWSPCFKVPGDYWGTQKNLEITPMAPDGTSTWAFGRTLTLYTYLQGWNAGPAHKYRLEFGPGETSDKNGYLGWGVGVETKKFWDPNWEGPATTDPLRPYGEPSYDLSDPIESRCVRKVSCFHSEMKYAGTWTRQDGPSPAMSSGTARDSLTFSFRGTGIYWRAAQGPDCGKADVILDGQPQKTVDCYGTYTPYKFWFVKTGLDAGTTHTVKIVVRGDKNERASGTRIVHLAFEHEAESNQASDGFSGVMGKNGWHYLAWDGKAHKKLEFQSKSNTWQTAGAVVIGPDYQTAGENWASVRQWVAPHDGTVRIEAAPRLDGADPGELSLVVSRNAETLWDARLAPPGATTATCDQTVVVRKADTVSFAVLKTSPAKAAGRVLWNPTITCVR
jgi:hypothetical protein